MINFKFSNLLSTSNFMSSHISSVTLYNRLIPHHFQHLFIYTFIYFISPDFDACIHIHNHSLPMPMPFVSFLFSFFYSDSSFPYYYYYYFCSIIQLLLLMMFHRGNLVKQEEENSIHRYFCFIGKQRWNLPSSRKIKFAMQIHFFLSSFLIHLYIFFSFIS